MILLEVSKTFVEHERLLGEHRWSEILKDPNEEEDKRVSRVFHSFYATGRDAQKDGSWIPTLTFCGLLLNFFFFGFRTKKGGKVLLSTQAGSRIGLQEKGNTFWKNQRHIYAEISSISRFKQPYPETHWCCIPVEDQTNKRLCRPIPVDRMSPPSRAEPPGNALF